MQNPFDFKLPLSAIFVKYSIFLFNLVAFICGLILLGISVSTAVTYSAGQPLENIYDEKYASLPIFIGIAGVFLSGLCFVGCWGAMKESWGMLMGYAIRLVIFSCRPIAEFVYSVLSLCVYAYLLVVFADMSTRIPSKQQLKTWQIIAYINGVRMARQTLPGSPSKKVTSAVVLIVIKIGHITRITSTGEQVKQC